MIQEEKDKLIALFDHESRWCRGADALDHQGNAAHYDNEAAVSWDLVGGLCHLFGWKRAYKLFESVSRHLSGRRRVRSPSQRVEIAAMSALLDFNDDSETTYELMITKLRDLPVWHSKRTPILPVEPSENLN